MAKTTFAGHPLHPILIAAPVALLPTSFMFDLMYLATENESYAEAAYYTMLGGYFGGIAAAAAGAGDYFTIPSDEHHLQTVANRHAVLNLSALALYSLNLLLRRGKRPATGALPIALSAIGMTGLFISAWFGGDMVYNHGMRVKGVSPIADAPEIKLPGDEQLEAVFNKLGDMGGAEQATKTQPSAPHEHH